MKYIYALTVSLVLISTAQAESFRHSTQKRLSISSNLTCTSITDVASLRNVLYKNDNVHGGRGRTFLDQDHRLKGTATLKVAGTNGKVFSCFGLYRCDNPFGCRYYQAMCYDRVSNTDFIRLARANGGTKYALVGKDNGPCYKIDTSLSRYGSVRK